MIMFVGTSLQMNCHTHSCLQDIFEVSSFLVHFLKMHWCVTLFFTVHENS